MGDTMNIEPIHVTPQSESDNEALIAWLVEKDIPFSINYGPDTEYKRVGSTFLDEDGTRWFTSSVKGWKRYNLEPIFVQVNQAVEKAS
jgi:hypothetical protein